VLTESAISGRVKNGAGRVLRLIRDGADVATATVAGDETYRFAGLPAGAYRVVLANTPLMSDVLPLDGTSTAVADLVAPAPDKLVPHYVLFGPARHPATEAHLLLAMGFLLEFGPSFGFNPAEAAEAGMVTIIAGPSEVNPETETHLVSSGALVQRIAGSDDEVAADLAARVAGGKPFV
jgi:hypothetical protein